MMEVDNIDLKGLVPDGAARRMFRMQMIVEMIKDNEGLTKKTIVGWIIINMGLTEKTAIRYIDELFKFGLIYKKGEKFYARK